ncbi:MAG TPA: hypothetical protein VKB93_23970 [Thermoanaerobaculia bacterium]|nr:hypothetical protein [Thermoanaerobaculia bacterium]
MSVCYRVYGLTLRADAPIAGLVPIAPVSPDIEIHLATRGAAGFSPPEPFGGLKPAAPRVFEYSDARFVVSDKDIWCEWTSTPEDAATYFLGPILAYALRRRGTLALHASSILVNERALLVAGAPGAGKSTVAAACALRGATVITDDVAAIEWRGEQPFVMAGYPRVRLWGDVAAALFGSEDALPLLTPTWNKRFAGDFAFATEASPIGAICVLTGRAHAAALRAVAGHEAAISLLRHASVTSLLEDALREDELAAVARLAASVPVFELTAPDDLRRAGEVCDLLTSLRAS